METTIELNGTEIQVIGDYQPSERQTHDYPGCPEQFEICELTIGDVDVMELLEDKWDKIVEAVIEQLHNNY